MSRDAKPEASVTCVIPTHDRDVYLSRAVNSILNQTVTPKQIVIADDIGVLPPRDEVAKILQLSASITYRVRKEGENGGASASRNAGARGANTEFIAFLDDDDEWSPDYLESMLQVMIADNTPLAVAWGRLVQGKRVKHNNWSMAANLTAESAARANPGFTGSNFVIRRDSFESAGGFDEQQWVFNDLDFLVRHLRMNERYSIVDRDVVTQHSAGGGHLSSRTNRRAAGIERFVEKHSDILDFSARRRYRRAAHLARVSPENGWVTRSIHYLLALVLSSPSDIFLAAKRRISNEPRY